jgi:hypothetical protein
MSATAHYPYLHIRAFSTPDYEPFNEIFDRTLKESLEAYSGTYDIRHDIQTLDNLDTNINVQHGSSVFKDIVHYKVKFIKECLEELTHETNSLFIFSDCDIQFFSKNSNKWNSLVKWFVEETTEIAFMREDTQDKLNTGFFIIKSTYYKNMIDILNLTYNVMVTNKNDLPFDEQTVLQILQPQMNMTYIPDEYVIFSYKMNREALFHHALGFPKRQEKIELLEMVRRYMESDGSQDLFTFHTSFEKLIQKYPSITNYSTTTITTT